MARRCAVLSVGTNSTRMLLADMEPRIPRIEIARAIGTRIGEGLRERGELREEAMARTLDALKELKAQIDTEYDTLVTIATSALRRARNREIFGARVRAVTGTVLRVLSGEEEAVASYRGAVASLGDDASSHGVVDVGGGSTEYALGTGSTPSEMRSFEVGAVRLTESIPALGGGDGAVDAQSRNAVYREAQASLAPMRALPRVDAVLCVGGTATTTAAILGGGAPAQAALRRDELRALFERLCDVDIEARRRMPGMLPQRADILPAGIAVLDTAIECAGHEHATVAPGDLLLGTLLQERERMEADEAKRRHGGTG